eukprot:1160508-Pelagomonas_calceolata.AAC.2
MHALTKQVLPPCSRLALVSIAVSSRGRPAIAMQNEQGQPSQSSVSGILPINIAQIIPQQQQAIIVCSACLLLLLLPRLRKKVLECLEAVLTVALIVVLAALVLCEFAPLVAPLFFTETYSTHDTLTLLHLLPFFHPWTLGMPFVCSSCKQGMPASGHVTNNSMLTCTFDPGLRVEFDQQHFNIPPLKARLLAILTNFRHHIIKH